MNVAYGRQVAALGISNAEWEVLKTLVLAGTPYRLGPGSSPSGSDSPRPR